MNRDNVTEFFTRRSGVNAPTARALEPTVTQIAEVDRAYNATVAFLLECPELDGLFTAKVTTYLKPHTGIVGAGIDSKYGHPLAAAIASYKAHHQTKGVSIKMVAAGQTVNSYKYED